MRHKEILALLILIVLLPACNRVVPSDAVPDDRTIILTAKRVLIVEHKLNAALEIRTDYIYKKGWTKLNTDITVLD